MTPKLGPFGGPTFGAANSSNFCNLALSTRSPQTSTQRGKLRTTTSAGSFLAEVIREKRAQGGLRTRSQNCSDFWTHIWSRANRYCKAFEASLAAFRGPLRPHSWGFEVFRGLTRPQQNPKTPLACKITRPRGPALIILLNGSPQGLEPGQTPAASSM